MLYSSKGVLPKNVESCLKLGKSNFYRIEPASQWLTAAELFWNWKLYLKKLKLLQRKGEISWKTLVELLRIGVCLKIFLVFYP